MRVTFNETDEFIEEIKKEFQDVSFSVNHKRIMRITGLLKQTTSMMRHFYLCATVLNMRGEIVLLEKHCGALWAADSPEDKKTQLAYDGWYNAVKVVADELGLEVRGGVYEEETNARVV